jgi:hypothetical protein
LAFVVVIDGGAEWISAYRSEVRGADCMITAADMGTLDRLGLVVVDRTWQPGDPSIDVDDLIFGPERNAEEP